MFDDLYDVCVGWVSLLPTTLCHSQLKLANVQTQRKISVVLTSSIVEKLRLQATRSDLASKEFQLEELEDKEECETSLRLNDDGTVTLGETNGPPVSSWEGSWSVIETASEADKPFRMRLTRTYESGGCVISSFVFFFSSFVLSC
jgi:hypothetical protein